MNRVSNAVGPPSAYPPEVSPRGGASRFRNVEIDPGVVRRLMKGNRKAQEIVYRAYANAVYTLARRILDDADLAEEVTQDTFVDVIRAVRRLERPESLGAWLRTTAVNHCLMRLRSPWHKRRQALPDNDLAANGANETVDDAQDRTMDIEQALGALPSNARLVVWMHCVEGYTHDEIGRAFGRTASFSKSQLARALKALAKHRGMNDEQQTTPATVCAS